MAQAVVERVEQQEYAEEEAAGGPQPLEALQVGRSSLWLRRRRRASSKGPGCAGCQQLTPPGGPTLWLLEAPCRRHPLQELGVQAGDIKKLKEGGELHAGR